MKILNIILKNKIVNSNEEVNKSYEIVEFF